MKIKIISGEVNGVKGPVQDIITEPEYLDITIDPNSEFSHPVKRGHNVFAYIIEGKGYFDQDRDKLIGIENLVIYKDGDEVKISTGDEKFRFLLISGKPIGEPVAWRVAIVMNTEEELRIAFQDYQNETFIKHN